MLGDDTQHDDRTRIRERDLVGPTIQLIAKYGDADRGLTVTRIAALLRDSMELSDDDRTILKGRKDDRFSQVVRNLVSHRTLERAGLAEYHRGGIFEKGSYVLTAKGRALSGVCHQTQFDLFRPQQERGST